MLNIFTEAVKADIFRKGAEITRRGTAELEEGTQQILVFGLTETANQDTARLLCGSGVTCSEMRITSMAGESSGNEEQTDTEERIAELQKEIEVRELQEELWKTNGDFSSRTSGPAAEIEAYIGKLPERIRRIREEIREFRKEIRELEQKKQDMEQRQKLPAIALEVTAEQAGPVHFELRYYESAAGWSSVNEIHSDAEKAPELRMRAKITQTTQEDWKNIQISLFTGNPSSGGLLPELRSRFLDIKEPVTVNYAGAAMPQTFMGMGMAMAQASGAMMNMNSAPMQRVETQNAEVRDDETMTEYVLPGTRNVPKGSRGNMADLQTVLLPAEYQVISAVPEDSHAYLAAVVKPSDLPFPEKVSAAVYLKGMYNGRTELDPMSGKEKTEITLGREERVRISRKEISRKKSTTLLKGQKVTEYVFETKVSNTSDREITLTLRDQIPVSRNKEIIVEMRESGGAELDAETGFLTKKITLSGGQSVSVPLSYKVSLPKDKELEETHQSAASSRGFCRNCGSRIIGNPRFCPECGGDWR